MDTLQPTIPKSQRQVLYTGSVKTIYDAGNGLMGLVHNDTWSAYDRGRSKQLIPGMGRSVMRSTIASARIAHANGIPTHFVGQEDDETILVRRYDTPKDRPLLLDEVDVMIRLEFIRRKIVSGRRAREYANGTRKPTQDGFPTDDVVPDGTPFPCPTHEVTTKWEKEDLQIHAIERILSYAGITADEWERAWVLVDTLSGALDLAAQAAGFTRLVGKMELAVVGPKGPGVKRKLVVIDGFGTQIEDRFSPTATRKPGLVDHWSKEWMRQRLIRKGIKRALDEARAKAWELPDYPILTDEEVAEIARRYSEFADAYEKAVY